MAQIFFPFVPNTLSLKRKAKRHKKDSATLSYEIVYITHYSQILILIRGSAQFYKFFTHSDFNAVFMITCLIALNDDIEINCQRKWQWYSRERMWIWAMAQLIRRLSSKFIRKRNLPDVVERFVEDDFGVTSVSNLITAVYTSRKVNHCSLVIYIPYALFLVEVKVKNFSRNYGFWIVIKSLCRHIDMDIPISRAVLHLIQFRDYLL